MRYQVLLEGEHHWLSDTKLEEVAIPTYSFSKDQLEAIAKTLNDMEPPEPGWYWVKYHHTGRWFPRWFDGCHWHSDTALSKEIQAEIGPCIREPKSQPSTPVT